MTKLRFYLLLVFTMWSFFSLAQEKAAVDSSKSTSIIPLIFYTPETGFGLGAAGIYSFTLNDAPLQSEIQLGLAYTTLKQILVYAPFQFMGSRWRIEGEAGFYRYTYDFYGVGYEQGMSIKEKYRVQYPRIRVSAYHRFKNLYLGARLVGDNFKMLSVEEGGLLEKDRFLGSNGAGFLGIGPAVVWDNRNDNFFPNSGNLISASFVSFPSSFTSYGAFTNLSISVSNYLSWNDLVLANQVGWESVNGAVPFYQMASVGGSRVLRGYYADRFRDRLAAFAQSELRYRPNRFGAVAFVGIGAVANTFDQFKYQELLYTGGVGLRYKLQKNSNINLRLDLGFTQTGESNFYFTVLEAF
ncbi:BamA/TamA family outer membrane protein [Luteibaculum oceani]|uniref:BamA/TamA family outer membrane protein n=1 Tax=Luteibaculum oceani TaxID=1294296 RepID=A0A5C6UUS2_9FLAO|nr:BamA/TamA family outer membrane protein [Luteibaculum oceani]TXC77133.1 BamA/TamA family outer membrane protein [Luteibaculum oceani]